MELVGVLLGEVVGLAPVGGGVVQLPAVVVEGRCLLADQDPGRLVPGHRGPALVVDAAVAEHLEVLGLVPVGRVRVVEAVGHADAVQRHLLHAVDADRLGQPRHLQDRGGQVDHVMELLAQLAAGPEAVRPVGDHPVAGAAEVGGHLLGPLVRSVHRMGPADRVVVVGVRPAEVVQPRGQELRCLDGRGAVEVDHLVEGPVEGALGRGAVVPDDVVDQRVAQDIEVLESVDQAPDVVVGVLQEAGVHLHLADQHRLERLGHVVPGRDLVVASGQLGVGRDHAQCLLPLDRLLAQPVPALVEPALVPVGPLLGDVVGGVGGAGGEVDEERLVAHQGLLLADPLDGLVGHVLHEVVALFGRLGGLHRGGALIDGRVVLVGLAADEPVEVLEAPAAGRPGVEGPGRAGLPHRDLVALAELGRRVAVELQRLGQRGRGVGPDRVVPGRRGGDLGDAAHANGVVVAAGEQRLAGRGAERGGVEPGELEAAVGQPLGRRHADRATVGAGGAKADVVQQHDQDVRGARAAAAARSAGSRSQGSWRRRPRSRCRDGPGWEGSPAGWRLARCVSSRSCHLPWSARGRHHPPGVIDRISSW